jgi:hypothetical protein
MKVGKKDIWAFAAELDRREKAKKDYLVDTRAMTMDAGPNVSQLSIRNDSTGETLILGINEIAHNQIGTHLGIPAKYYDKMRSDNPELLAQNVNSWFNKNPKTRMVRTLDGVARAFLSERYRRIDNFEIANTVLPIIAEMPEARIESSEITDERMYIKVVNPRLTTEVVPGDIVQSGIIITNSEVGLSSFTIQPLAYRLVCSNGMVINDARTRKYHIGRGNEAAEDFTVFSNETLMADDKALQLKIRDTVRSVVDKVRFEKVVDLMRQAKGATIDAATNIPAMVELAGSDFKYTKQEGEGILGYLIRGGDMSLYGLANATTRFAQDVESYDRSTALESIGYDILNMSRNKWESLQKDSAGAVVA